MEKKRDGIQRLGKKKIDVNRLMIYAAGISMWLYLMYCENGERQARRAYLQLPQESKDKIDSMISQERHDSLMTHNEAYRATYERERQEERELWEEYQRRLLGRSFEQIVSNLPGVFITPYDCRKLKGGALEYERGGQKITFSGNLDNLSMVEYQCNISGGMFPAHEQFLTIVFANILGHEGAETAHVALQSFLHEERTDQQLTVADRHVTFRRAPRTGDITVLFVR